MISHPLLITHIETNPYIFAIQLAYRTFLFPQVDGELHDWNLFFLLQQDSGFSWSNVISMVMQLLFNPAGPTGPSKSDALDADNVRIHFASYTLIILYHFHVLTTIYLIQKLIARYNSITVDQFTLSRFENLNGVLRRWSSHW